MNALKNLIGMCLSGGLAIGASSLLTKPAWGQAQDAMGIPGGIGEAGAFGVIGVLVWLLQQSTRERVAEAKEYAESQKQTQKDHVAMVLSLFKAESSRNDRLLNLIEQAVPVERLGPL